MVIIPQLTFFNSDDEMLSDLGDLKRLQCLRWQEKLKISQIKNRSQISIYLAGCQMTECLPRIN